MGKYDPVEPKDRLGKEILNDIKSYTSYNQAVPEEEKAYNTSMRKSGVSPLEYRMGRPRTSNRKMKKG